MDRNVQKIGVINLIALLLVGIASAMVAQYAISASAKVGVVFLAMGVLVTALSCFQMRLAAREQLESLELDELKKGPSSSALFASPEADVFPARRARLQFDRYFVPGFTLLLFFLQAGVCYGLWRWLPNASPIAPERATLGMSLMLLFALLCFLLGKYAAGIARLEGQRLLQPGASYLLLGSVVCVLVVVAEVSAWFGYLRLDPILARILCVVLGLIATENLITLLLEIYRPRVQGQVTRLLYESRLIGLLGQPGGLITTAAQALDYQFGFQVSETWFYQFLEKALAWIVLLQLAVLWLSTTVVMIEPSEQALLERFGRPVEGRPILEPGIHFKWPWPIDQVFPQRTREIQTFYIGFVPDPEREKERTLLWTRPHFKEEFNLLVASRDTAVSASANPLAAADQAVPVNLLSVNIPVQYRIRDLHAWVYNHAETGSLLEKLANREVVRYLVNVDIDDIMAAGRLRAAAALKQRIQARADENKLGVEVIFVGLQGIHPPIKVAPDYEAVVGALQEKQTNILGAQAYWAEKIPLAHAEATNLLSQAINDALTKVTTAAAEAGQFANQLQAFHASPSVYVQRTYLETLVTALKPARKYVIGPTNTQDIIWMNLEDKLRPDLLDVPVPAGKK